MPLTVSQMTRTGWRDLGASGPAPTSLLMGAASFHAPLSSQQSWTQVLEPQVGPMTVRRSYQSEAQGIPSSWAASEAALDVGVRAAVLSLRPPIATFQTGSLDAALRAFLASVPDDGFPKFLVPWHEADSKVRRGEYTRAQWMSAARRFGDIVHDAAIPNLYVTPCMTGWLWHDPAQGAGQPEQWWQDGVYDVWSVDYYNDAPAAMFGPVVQYARDHQIPWAVAETGWIDDFDAPAVKAQRIADTAAYCATTGSGGFPTAVFQTWFDSDVGFDPSVSALAFTPTSSAASIAAANVACQTYYRDPRTVIL
ncbi:hypothetical protein [Thermomonospora umbrina]|uniref:GH26 domain-containing protein n=1 Tax=Thermomonospora umbrina TaxID=111806 RepID=A0A3D9SXI8_9ACTN|nr:hypothetical protein [Thermomonospora umbrina]REF00278.1 hypothetical protein DFJ69_5807 [Thermomonospora umbrina]